MSVRDSYSNLLAGCVSREEHQGQKAGLHAKSESFCKILSKHEWLSELWSRFGYPKYLVRYYNRDPKGILVVTTTHIGVMEKKMEATV